MFKENGLYMNNHLKSNVRIVLEDARKNEHATKFKASVHYFLYFTKRKLQRKLWKFFLRHLERPNGS